MRIEQNARIQQFWACVRIGVDLRRYLSVKSSMGLLELEDIEYGHAGWAPATYKFDTYAVTMGELILPFIKRTVAEEPVSVELIVVDHETKKQFNADTLGQARQLLQQLPPQTRITVHLIIDKKG